MSQECSIWGHAWHQICFLIPNAIRYWWRPCTDAMHVLQQGPVFTLLCETWYWNFQQSSCQTESNGFMWIIFATTKFHDYHLGVNVVYNCCRTSTSSDATSADLQIRHQYQRHVWILFVISSAKLSQACFNWEVSHVFNLLEHQNGAGTDDPPVPWCASVNCIEQWSSKCEPWLWNFRQQLYQTKILIHFQKTLAPSMLQDCQWPGCILEINCCSKTVTPCHGKNHQEMVLDSRVLLSNSVKVKYCASSNAMLTHDIWSKPNSHGVTCQTTHLPAPCCDRTQ